MVCQGGIIWRQLRSKQPRSQILALLASSSPDEMLYKVVLALCIVALPSRRPPASWQQAGSKRLRLAPRAAPRDFTPGSPF